LRRDTGVIVKTEGCDQSRRRGVSVFIDRRTHNAPKARLNTVIDAWGTRKFITAVEEKLGWEVERAPAEGRHARGPAFGSRGAYRRSAPGQAG